MHKATDTLMETQRRLRALDLIQAASKTAVILFVASFFVAAWFARPSADDFCFGATVVEEGVLGAMADWYGSHLGFYTTAGLMSLASASRDLETVYPYVLWGVYCASIAGVWCLLRVALGHVLSKWESLWAALIWFAITVSMLPSIREGLYWMNGVVAYTLGSALFAVLLAALIKARNSRGTLHRTAFFALSAVFVALAVGMNPFLLATCVAMLSVGLLIDADKTFPRTMWLSLLAIGLAVSLLILSAPGTAARAAKLQHTPAMLEAIIGTVSSGANFSVYWASNLVLWATLALAVPTLVRTASMISGTHPALGWRGTVILAAALALCFLGFFPTNWAMGTAPTSRHLNVAFSGFVFAWFLGISVLILWVAKRDPGAVTLPASVNFGAHFALILSLLNSPNLHSVAHAIADGPAFANQHEQRYRLISKAKQKGERTLELPELSVRPDALHFADITSNPENWQNACFATYFGVDSVVAVPR